MELLKKTSPGSVIRGKRPVDHSKLEEFRKHRTLPQVVRDFPLDNVEGDDNLLDTLRVDNNKLNRYKSKVYERNKSYNGSRPPGKVQFWDPTCSNEGGHAQKPQVTTTIVTRTNPLKNLDSNVDKDNNNKLKCTKPEQSDAQKQNDTITVVSHKEKMKREKIIEAMTMFYEVNELLYQDNRLKPKGEKIAHWMVPVKAAKKVKEKLKWMDHEKRVGPICGVEIGDKFKYRSQLQMVGLHCQGQSGIDYMKIQGKNVAISIVDSHRYSNESGSCNMLIYCGQGGQKGFLNGKPQGEDQKLERGNLALKNSMDEKSPVRVIRKVYEGAFVYDGLYIVNRYTQMKTAKGNIMFKFQLNRVPGQCQLHKMVNSSSW